MNYLSANEIRSEASVFGLLEVARILEERIEGSLAELDLSLTKLSVLNALAAGRDPLTLGELAAAAACVRSNMTHVVDRLEADGLVKRVADPSDRRVVRAELTPLGAERQRAGEERIAEVQAEFSATVSEADREVIDRLALALK